MSLLRSRSASLHDAAEKFAFREEKSIEKEDQLPQDRRKSSTASVPRKHRISTLTSRSDFAHSLGGPFGGNHANNAGLSTSTLPLLIEEIPADLTASPTAMGPATAGLLGLGGEDRPGSHHGGFSPPWEAFQDGHRYLGSESRTSTDHLASNLVHPTEQTPSLPDQSTTPTPDVLEDGVSLMDVDDFRIDLTTCLREGKRVVQLAWPVTMAYLLSYFAQSTAIFFVGRLGASQLAAASLAILFTNVCGMSILVGLSTSLDTIMSQAYTAASDPHALGWILQRGIVMIVAACIPLLVVWWFAGTLLVALGQPVEEAAMAGQMIRVMMPALIPYGICECLKRFCQAQHIMGASTTAVLFTTLLNIPLTWFLVWSKWGLGVVGAAVAIDVVNWLNVLLMLVYIRFVAGHEAWGGWSRHALQSGWYPMFKLAVPGVFQVGAEWWAFEVASLMAGLVGSLALASQSVLLTMTSFTYMLPLGISVAASLRVGNFLGAQRPGRAKLAAITSIALAVPVGLLNMAVLLVFRDRIGGIFSKDKHVISLVSQVAPLAATFQVLDGLGGVCGGIIRGVGNQRVGAAFSSVGYYVLGLPVGAFLVFHQHMGLKGIWLGLCVGLLVVSLGQFAYIVRIKWMEAAVKAQHRTDAVLGNASPSDVDGRDRSEADAWDPTSS